jgi:inner membrane protein
MTKNGHQLTGLATAAMTYCLADSLGGLAWVAAPLALFGATAPDWLEIAWYDVAQQRRRSVIPHRTLTHWVPLWVALFLAGLYIAPTLAGSAALGFAAGGLTHLLCDWPNPTGLPFGTPFGKRHSLRWWRSGEMEWLVVPCFSLLAVGAVILWLK